jgi:CDP-glycerol glycerophosphotransferase
MRAGVRLRRGLHRLSTEAVRRVHLPVRVPRLLSIVVTLGDDAQIGECLNSVRAQQYDACEILVVDVGAPAAARAVADRHARADRRVRVLEHQGGLAAGRNHGAAAAVGELLAFVDADDAVTPHGFALAAAALRESGSDLAVTAHRPMRRGHRLPVTDRVRAVHSVGRLGTTLEDFPDAVSDTVTGTRVFRRRRYDELGLAFEEDFRACDALHSMTASYRARSFDVLPHVGLLRRVDLDRSGLTRLAPDLDGLRAWWAGLDAALRVLPQAAAEVAAAEAMAGPLVPFTDRAWRCPDDYWDALVEVAERLRGVAAAQVRMRVPAYQKIVTSLVADGDRDGVRRLLTQVRPSARRCPTEIRVLDGCAAVLLDLGPDWRSVEPADRVLSDRETAVRAELTSLRTVGEGRLEVRGWAYLDNIDLADRTSEVTLTVRSGTDHVDVPVVRRDDPDADVAGELWWADVTRSGFSAVIDTGALQGGTGVWHVDVTVSVASLSATGRAVVRPWTMAGVPAWSDAEGRRWHLDHDDAEQAELRVRRTPWPEVRLSVDGDVLHIAFPSSVRSVSAEAPGRAPVAASVAGATAYLPVGGLGGGCYSVRAVDTQGSTHDVMWPAAGVDDVRVRPDRRGVLTVSREGAEVVAARLDGETLVVGLRVTHPADTQVGLLVGRQAMQGVARVDGDLVEAVLPLAGSRWGRPDLPLPSGRYAVAVRRGSDPAGPWTPARAGDELCAALPADELQDRMRLRVEAFSPDRPGVRVVVEPPLADDERGQRQQRLLREQARVEVADRDSVFFRSMFSEHAHGNGLGVHEELVRRGAPWELVWSVLDRSVPVPPGGVGLVERSRAWHDAVARSRFHVVDVHQLEWFVRPEGQTLIQTFHGYPYKVMGHEWWEKLGNPVQEIGSLDRRTRDWSALVSPAPYATPLLRRAFLEPAGADDVPVLEIGYPRNDVLLRPEAADLRTRTRALLGLGDDAVAVLYAPTFRDYLSPEDRTARTVDFLDVGEALDLLPEHYVVLMRGHAFNARVRADRVDSSARVVDVTDHPDPNHLILASDVGVLDYSSLRFDYVLTGNPMVFLVPDLADYDASRGGVIPYGPTAPGPQVSTTRELVEWVRDLPRLREEYADARARFRADYVGLEDGHAAARLVDVLFR